MCAQSNAGRTLRSFRGRAGRGQGWPSRCIGAWLFLAACAAVQAVPADPNAGDCRVENLSLNRISPVFDGNWQGIAAASDGRCYFGSSTHAPDRGAGFFRFDPETGELKVLADDLTVVAGYDPAETVPQGKVHSPIVEAGGWLYFTTHLANYWPEAQRRVFMVGSWTVADPAEATRQYIWEDQPFWPDAEPGAFKPMQRGEYFGHIGKALVLMKRAPITPPGQRRFQTNR